MTRATTTQLGVMAVAAAALFLRGHRRAALVLAGMAAVVLVLSLAAPDTLATLQGLVARAGTKLSSALGIVTLTIVYLLVFVPGALWLKIWRIDPLNRRFPGQKGSNWIHRVGYGKDKGLYAKPYSRPHHAGRSESTRP
jgi:hypothetical protein